LNRFYSTQHIVSMTEVTNTIQWKDETILDYINRWRVLSLSEVSAVEMCTQGMACDLLYVLQMSKTQTFQDLATKAHDMEVTIANRRDSSFSVTESKNDGAEFKKNAKFSTSLIKETITISKASPIQISRGPNPTEKRSAHFNDTFRRRPTLKELQQKKYPFPYSNLLGMVDDLLEQGVIQLPEPKRPEDVKRAADLKYCHYHRMVTHPLEKCVKLRERIMRLI